MSARSRRRTQIRAAYASDLGHLASGGKKRRVVQFPQPETLRFASFPDAVGPAERAAIERALQQQVAEALSRGAVDEGAAEYADALVAAWHAEWLRRVDDPEYSRSDAAGRLYGNTLAFLTEAVAELDARIARRDALARRLRLLEVRLGIEGDAAESIPSPVLAPSRSTDLDGFRLLPPRPTAVPPASGTDGAVRQFPRALDESAPDQNLA